MNPSLIPLILDGLAALGPVLAELGSLAGKLKEGVEITEADLARAEASRRAAFDALRRELTAGTDSGN